MQLINIKRTLNKSRQVASFNSSSEIVKENLFNVERSGAPAKLFVFGSVLNSPGQSF